MLLLFPISPTWCFLAFYLLLHKCFPCCCLYSTPCFSSFGCEFSTPPPFLGSLSSFTISPPLGCRHLNFRLPEKGPKVEGGSLCLSPGVPWISGPSSLLQYHIHSYWIMLILISILNILIKQLVWAGLSSEGFTCSNTSLILLTSLKCRYYYFPHFTDETREADK